PSCDRSENATRSGAASELKRELAPVGATLFTAGMIVGTGIFAAFGAATNAAGTGILLAIVLGGTVALATGISAAQLGVNFPEEGGAFTWARAFDHDTIGFIAGCGYLGKALVSMSVVAAAAAVGLPVAAITLGVLGADELGRDDTPLLSAARRAADWLFWPVLAAAIVAALGDMLGILLTASRVALAMAKVHELPRALAAVHERFRTPHRSVAALGIASAALVFLFDLRSLIEVASAFMLLWYLVTHFAALQ